MPFFLIIKDKYSCVFVYVAYSTLCHAISHQILFLFISVIYGVLNHAIGYWVLLLFFGITYCRSSHTIGHQTSYCKSYKLERAFLPLGIFTLHSYLLLSRLSWQQAVLLWKQQGFMLHFKIQSQPNCLFESHNSLLFSKKFYVSMSNIMINFHLKWKA